MLSIPNRLTKDKDFKRVFQKGRSFFSKVIGFKALKNDLESSRFGIVVSTKISKKATIRNRIKRQIGEVIRLNLDKIKTGYDVVLITLPAIVNKKYAEIEKEVMIALKKLNLLK